MSLWIDRAVLFLDGKSLTKTDWLLLGLCTRLGPGPGWQGWLSRAPCSLSSSSRHPRLTFMAAAGFQEREKVHKTLWGLGSELGQYQFHWSFLAWISHKGSPDLRQGGGVGSKPCPSLKRVDAKSKSKEFAGIRSFFSLSVFYHEWFPTIQKYMSLQFWARTWGAVGMWAWSVVERRSDQHSVFPFFKQSSLENCARCC